MRVPIATPAKTASKGAIELAGRIGALHERRPQPGLHRLGLFERQVGQRGERVDHRAGRHIDAPPAQLIDENLDATDQRMNARDVPAFTAWPVGLDAAGRAEQVGQDHAAQLLQRHSCRVGADVDRGKRSTAAIAQRRGHRSDALLELLIDQRVSLAANRVDLGSQRVDVGDRLRRRAG